MNASIAWFVRNPIAANLLMLLILASGIIGAMGMGKEVFPSTSINLINISMPYPGAGPREVEEQIVVRIEEAIYNLEGIKHIRSQARQSSGRVTVEIADGYDMANMINDIKARVDSIITFPSDAERAIITEQKMREEVIRVALFGDAGEAVLREYGQRIRNELAALPDVDFVELWGVREPQIDIELSEMDMRRYGISFDDVVGAVRQSSLNLPAGTIRAESGDIQIQTRGQAYYEEDFKRIVVSSRADGTEIKIEDVATVIDGFEERNLRTRFNGENAIFLGITVGKNPDVVATTAAVKDYVNAGSTFLPPGLQLQTWKDYSNMFSGRLTLLSKNAFGGLILVFVVLMLFLRPQLAFWVALGIAIAYMGALWILPSIGLTLNMMSMFSFLLILGIIVDDAIIVGESIYRHQQLGYDGDTAARLGTQAVAKPVLLAVVSTMIVFLPMLFLPGMWPKFLWAIPAVTLVALSFSLVESFWILPSHLAKMQPEKPATTKVGMALRKVRKKFADGLMDFSHNIYGPFLEKALNWRALTLIGFCLAFALSITLVSAGYIKQRFMPDVPLDFISMRIEMPDGYSAEGKIEITQRAERAAQLLASDPAIKSEIDSADLVANQLSFMYGDTIRLLLELQPDMSGQVSPTLVGERWQSLIGEIPEAKTFNVDASAAGRGNGERITAVLTSNNLDQLTAAALFLKQRMADIPGARNIRDDIHSGRSDIDITLRPYANNFGIGLADIARQVRHGFYGAEAQRVPRGRDDVRVMVRYPKQDRTQVDTLDNMRIRTPNGTEVPFYSVAQANYVPGYTRINRQDRQRSVKVSAGPTAGKLTIDEMAGVLFGEIGPELQQLYPEVVLNKDEQLAEQSEFFAAAAKLFVLALGMIYILMAVEFKSYLKPLGVLSAVPFGIMGAVFGHFIMGLNFSVLSFLGVLAASGVVVNDNLVLIDRINQLREEGLAVKEALMRAGQERFRPIILTSLTTFIGLAPILLETSMQARFLIPMIASLAFGVLFATVVTLVFVPCLYLSGANLNARWEKRMLQPVQDSSAESGV
jgi:multidrug efflux pump subunit AcrB